MTQLERQQRGGCFSWADVSRRGLNGAETGRLSRGAASGRNSRGAIGQMWPQIQGVHSPPLGLGFPARTGTALTGP